MLTVLCWKWGTTKYGVGHVQKLKDGVARNLKMKHRFVCVTNDPAPCDTIPIEDEDLLKVRDGCYARLRQFDPEWQARHGIEKLVCLDLDMVVTGPLDPLFDRPEPFMMLLGAHYNPCRVNGSVQMVERGARAEIWTQFNVNQAERIALKDGTHRGTDQTWIAHMAPDAPGWTWRDGIYGFRKPGWGDGYGLPAGARLVAFPGSKDPSKFHNLSWIRENWR